jgi:hypothetical protein
MSEGDFGVLWDGSGWNLRIINPFPALGLGPAIGLRYSDEYGRQVDISCDGKWNNDIKGFTSFMLYRNDCYYDMSRDLPSTYSRSVTDEIVSKVADKLIELGKSARTSPY